MNNYLLYGLVEIRLICEDGRAIFSYKQAEIEYNGGTSKTAYISNDITNSDGKGY